MSKIPIEWRPHNSQFWLKSDNLDRNRIYYSLLSQCWLVSLLGLVLASLQSFLTKYCLLVASRRPESEKIARKRVFKALRRQVAHFMYEMAILRDFWAGVGLSQNFRFGLRTPHESQPSMPLYRFRFVWAKVNTPIWGMCCWIICWCLFSIFYNPCRYTWWPIIA